MHLASPRIFYAVKRVSVSEFFTLSWTPLPFLGVFSTIPLLLTSGKRLAAASILFAAAIVPLEYGFQLAASVCWILLSIFLARRSIDFSETLGALSLLILAYTMLVTVYLTTYPFLPFETRFLDDAALAWVKGYATLQPFGAFSYIIIPFGALLPVYAEMLRRRSLKPVFRKTDTRVQELLSLKQSRIVLLLSLFLSIYLSVSPGLTPV